MGGDEHVETFRQQRLNLSEEEIKKTDTYKAFVETARTSSKKMLQHKDEELQKLKDDNTNKDAEIEALRTEVEKELPLFHTPSSCMQCS